MSSAAEMRAPFWLWRVMSTARQAAVIGTIAAAAVVPAAVPAAHAAVMTPSPLTAAPVAGAPVLPDEHYIRATVAAEVLKLISEPASHVVTIGPGGSLSGIAARDCGNPADWTGIWEQNRREIPDPDMVYPGQKVRFTCEELTRLLGAADSGADQPSYQGSQSGPVVTTAAVSTSSSAGSYGNVNPASYSSGYQQCVISRESGGQSQIMNSSGHYGLYQFSASTWAAYGGSPADFGHASPAEQTRIYENVVAAGATYGTWSEWDGC